MKRDGKLIKGVAAAMKLTEEKFHIPIGIIHIKRHQPVITRNHFCVNICVWRHKKVRTIYAAHDLRAS